MCVGCVACPKLLKKMVCSYRGLGMRRYGVSLCHAHTPPSPAERRDIEDSNTFIRAKFFFRDQFLVSQPVVLSLSLSLSLSLPFFLFWPSASNTPPVTPSSLIPSSESARSLTTVDISAIPTSQRPSTRRTLEESLTRVATSYNACTCRNTNCYSHHMCVCVCVCVCV